MESSRALTTVCILLCLFLSASFSTHSVVDARKLVGFERDSKKKPKKMIIKAFKHTTLLEKMMTQLNLAQPLEYSTTSSNTQPYGVSTTLTLPPYASLPPLPVPGNAPPFCVNPPNTPLNSPPSISSPGLNPPPGPITVPNPPESSSNPNSNPNPPDSTSNPNSNPNPPESSSNPNPPDSSSNPNPPVTIPSPPESSSNPNPPESSSNPNPPITVPYPPESSSPNPPETVPSPPESGHTPGPSGPISGPPYNEPSPSTPTDTPTTSGNLPGPSTPTNTPTPSGNLPSPTGSVPTPSSGFLPPIVYPPPMVPPPSSMTPTSAYWCVAKPTVPDPIIQEAMNFACGSGADCHSIQPNGPCFKPNTLWAHASFAFNSYWQRTKSSGGSCTFGGTGMLVTVDPSYNGCHFDFF
ncbi:leucine-rich repeat extensin-like protein 5 isoform X1 [Raphanus sativus]|uniref:Leucine-rich repeat extensin-like protein 5 isoform X1 n=1 Tax=Raphanus sativus TaxID=3726 RepID=A0A9W3CDT2_RAPSA|nr:leucine-rich repeat extensin-like protein 5 isoform X1 [Raphanus sativus]